MTSSSQRQLIARLKHLKEILANGYEEPTTTSSIRKSKLSQSKQKSNYTTPNRAIGKLIDAKYKKELEDFRKGKKEAQYTQTATKHFKSKSPFKSQNIFYASSSSNDDYDMLNKRANKFFDNKKRPTLSRDDYFGKKTKIYQTPTNYYNQKSPNKRQNIFDTISSSNDDYDMLSKRTNKFFGNKKRPTLSRDDYFGEKTKIYQTPTNYYNQKSPNKRQNIFDTSSSSDDELIKQAIKENKALKSPRSNEIILSCDDDDFVFNTKHECYANSKLNDLSKEESNFDERIIKKEEDNDASKGAFIDDEEDNDTSKGAFIDDEEDNDASKGAFIDDEEDNDASKGVFIDDEEDNDASIGVFIDDEEDDDTSKGVFIDDDEEKKYHKIISKIGEGSKMIAYKILDTRTKQIMCKKILKYDENIEIKDAQNVMKEFEILHEINHPCIYQAFFINISENIKTNDDEYITTISLFLEYLEFNLKDFLENEKLDNTAKTKIVIEIVHGMMYLHKHCLIRRNIKIDNIMLNSKHEAKIIGFELISIKEYCLMNNFSIEQDSLTRKVGDFKYMSPEMINEENYDSKTDVYSFGIVLYYIFMNKLPKKINGNQIKLPKKSSSISEFCINLIKQCLSVKPEDRPTFKNILDDIRDQSYELAPNIDKTVLMTRDEELINFI